MALRIIDRCFGCGACEAACSAGAMHQSEGFLVSYAVDPLLCNDCGDCVTVCPVDAFEPDPEWAVCFGRGCPLSSARYEGWTCSQGQVLCPLCGSMMWRPADGEWVCSNCRLGTAGRGARCPKTERVRRRESLSPGPA